MLVDEQGGPGGQATQLHKGIAFLSFRSLPERQVETIKMGITASRTTSRLAEKARFAPSENVIFISNNAID